MDAASLIAAIILTISPLPSAGEMNQQIQAEARETPPAPQNAPAPQPEPAVAVALPETPAPSPSISGVWYRLAVCESGNGRTSPNIYQFKQSTWEGMGMSGRPGDASRAIQLETAQRLVARYGFRSQFPACSRRLGLR